MPLPLLHHTNSMDGGVTSAIQLALTPAFLLTGISSLLNVMTGRLSRIVERGRLLHGSSRHGGHDEFAVELRHLERRLRLTSQGDLRHHPGSPTGLRHPAGPVFGGAAQNGVHLGGRRTFFWCHRGPGDWAGGLSARGSPSHQDRPFHGSRFHG